MVGVYYNFWPIYVYVFCGIWNMIFTPVIFSKDSRSLYNETTGSYIILAIWVFFMVGSLIIFGYAWLIYSLIEYEVYYYCSVIPAAVYYILILINGIFMYKYVKANQQFYSFTVDVPRMNIRA
jgi:hypothetical protein